MATVTAPTQLQPLDIAAIHGLIEPWARACVTRDWDALLSMCTRDVAFLPPGEPIVQGATVRAWLDAFPETRAMWWDISQLEGQSDLACLRGNVHLTLVVDAKVVRFEGKYSDTMRKEADGQWRFATITWNSNS
jgi:ketosteroid isomerase-like protein